MTYFENLPLGRAALSAVTLSAALAFTILPGCNFGGLNDEVHQPGDEPGGVDIASGDIAVAPDGDYFLFERDGRLAIGWTASTKVQDLSVPSPDRLAFAKGRRFAYVTTRLGSVYAVDIDRAAVAWSTHGLLTQGGNSRIVSSQDDERVVVGDGAEVTLLDAATGSEVSSLPVEGLVDLEILPDDERVLAVQDHQWSDEVEPVPTTEIQIIALEDGVSRPIEVPNCADDIIVPAHGEMALLAPTTCQLDPISHIDLSPGEEAFVRNLPGFGPVALGPEGELAVGFLNLDNVDPELFDDPADIPEGPERFHLMVIDTTDMSYTFHTWGESLPRYAMTPDGHMLLVDESLDDQSARLFDLQSKTFNDITGPAVSFEKLTFSGDSSHAYVLSDPIFHAQSRKDAWTDYELFDLTIGEATVKKLPTDFRPRNLNLAPNADKLFLRKDDSSICVYSLETLTCTSSLDLLADAE